MWRIACHNCGTCCRKGGPILHTQDMPLVAAGRVPLSALITVRRGEFAHDPVTGLRSPLTSETVKIRGTGQDDAPWRCILHTDMACSIYADRPAQCRALFCEDTTALAALYATDRASRADVLAHAPLNTGGPNTNEWTALIEAHESRCDVQAFALSTEEERYEIMRYDAAFRDLCVTKAGINADILDFLLGRPLTR